MSRASRLGHARIILRGDDVRFSNPYTFLARDKDVVDEAFPDYLVGLFVTVKFKIGDTLTDGEEWANSN